jgi:hypothetical protein
MSSPKDYSSQDANGVRFDFHGVATNYPLDALPEGKYPYAQNVRAYQKGRIYGRATQTAPVLSLPQKPVYTVRRLNDTSANGPAAGYVLVSSSEGNLYVGPTPVIADLSGNPVSLVPFRPNTSVEPWMFMADANAMWKVRSDGTAYKMGIAEPQAAPGVSTQATTTTGSVIVTGKAVPWSNVNAQNPAYNYGDDGTGQAPTVIPTPLANASITLTATGFVVAQGVAYGPDSPSGNALPYPGTFATNGGPVAALMGAFTDASGNIVSQVSSSDLDIVSIGAGRTLLVPTNAVQLQLGMNAQGGTYAGNSGTFEVNYTLTASDVSTKVALGGPVTAYYWGDSPHSGPVGLYIWQSASDGRGAGPIRGISDAVGSTQGTSLEFDTLSGGGNPTLPVAWNVYDSSGESSGATSVFEPALETEGYQDFNLCIVGQIYFPAAGSYEFEAKYKDNILWGFGDNATWAAKGTVTGNLGQQKTVVSGLPLLPAPVENAGGTTPGTSTVIVTVQTAGLYDFEVDWDYWYHSGRTLTIKCNQQSIFPLTGDVKTNVQYRYTWRSSATGATSNPSPESTAEAIPVLANTVVGTYSTDPQVDKLDFYRMDTTLDNFTYVGTAENTNPPTPFTDTLLDIDVSANPLLEFDNFEPFPSLDLPRRGTVDVVGGSVYWRTGDQFNVRWLPGSIINIGGIAYSLDKRPSSPTVLTAGDVAGGDGLIYEIDAATLAAQPLPSMWGPTSEGNYMFACGDPLRPGTVYWTKGQNPDSAPDTNQLDLTSPSEPLINGCVVNGRPVIFSAERSWNFYPTTTSALATVTGETGSTWNPVLSTMTRGLYIRNCLAVSGGGDIFFRTKDGIAVSQGGGTEQSITDADLYNLFSHEGYEPQPIIIAGFTLYPPDDTRPEAQQLAFATGYLYYDYQDTGGNPRTLVYDTAAGGWVVDVYQYPAIVHALEEGPDINGVLLGCTDGSIRTFESGAPETAKCVVLTPCLNAGQARADKQVGDIFFKAAIGVGDRLSVVAYSGRFVDFTYPLAPSPLTGSGASTDFILNFDGYIEVDDIEMEIVWSAGFGTGIELWQPSWIPLPDTSQNRVTDWSDGGYQGAKFVQGVRIEANTFNLPKGFSIQSSDDLSLHVPHEVPATFNGQTTEAFSVQPFIAHNLRIVPQDIVNWRVWGIQYLFQPYPELVDQFQTELVSYGPGWQSIREMNIAYISQTPLTLTLIFDQWPTIVMPAALLPASPSQLYPVKTKLTIPPNKSKLMGFGITSTGPFRLFKNLIEVKVGIWGRSSAFENVQPFGGDSSAGAEV